MTSERQYTPVDELIMGLSHSLDTLFGKPVSSRPYPGVSADSAQLTESGKQQSARYMRVNHVGEVCAQALYQSQALTARNRTVSAQMQQAAAEEVDHLSWCEQRIGELGGRKSLLNPLWYSGAFAIGVVAGVAGDRWNLGFVAETERQVVDHLEQHLGKLPESDLRSREIVSQMQQDENNHAEQAVAAGAAELPPVARLIMKCASKVMTTTAHWI